MISIREYSKPSSTHCIQMYKEVLLELWWLFHVSEALRVQLISAVIKHTGGHSPQRLVCDCCRELMHDEGLIVCVFV